MPELGLVSYILLSCEFRSGLMEVMGRYPSPPVKGYKKEDISKGEEKNCNISLKVKVLINYLIHFFSTWMLFRYLRSFWWIDRTALGEVRNAVKKSTYVHVHSHVTRTTWEPLRRCRHRTTNRYLELK